LNNHSTQVLSRRKFLQAARGKARRFAFGDILGKTPLRASAQGETILLRKRFKGR
jgi:hypothetical protein